MSEERFNLWSQALAKRHGQNLSFKEIRKGLQALSTLYVQKREQISRNALDGAGKRAAFASFYGPLHFLLVAHIVRELELGTKPCPQRIVDLGCGTGIAGMAWGSCYDRPPTLLGVDRNRWALGEARWSYQQFKMHGSTRVADAAKIKLEERGLGVVAAFAVNELPPHDQDSLLKKLLKIAKQGGQVLIIEPIAKRQLPWWEAWASHFVSVGGRQDTWRFATNLPQYLADLDRAAGLNHRELKGRSLWLGT